MKINEKTTITIPILLLGAILIILLSSVTTYVAYSATLNHNVQNHEEDIKILKENDSRQDKFIIETRTDIKWIRKSVEILLGQNNE